MLVSHHWINAIFRQRRLMMNIKLKQCGTLPGIVAAAVLSILSISAHAESDCLTKNGTLERFKGHRE
jgi:hypothetical protein